MICSVYVYARERMSVDYYDYDMIECSEEAGEGSVKERNDDE